MPFEIIPGVSSAIAAPAYAGIPVTHRGLASSVAFITGHEDPEKLERAVDWSTLARGADTLVLLMGTGQLSEIAEQLVAAGRPSETPAAVVEWGTLPRQRTVTGTLADIAEQVSEAGIEPPAITVVGDVVRLRESMRWFDARPLSGLRVLVTRTREQASELSRRLEEAGAEAIELPTLEIVAAIRRSGAHHRDRRSWATGRTAGSSSRAPTPSTSFSMRSGSSGHDARDVQANVAAIGSATAEALGWWGIFVDVLPEADAYTAEGLVAAFEKRSTCAASASCFRAPKVRATPLIEGLAARGASVDEVTLYAAEVPGEVNSEGLRRLRAGEIDVVTFASSSSVRNLVAMLSGDVEPLRSRAHRLHRPDHRRPPSRSCSAESRISWRRSTRSRGSCGP